MRVALLGTGLLGEAIGLRLRSLSYPLVVWNRTKAKTARLAKEGAQVSDTPSGAVSEAEAVITVLSGGPVTEAVLLASNGPSLSGKTVVQMGTIAAGESARIARRVQAAGGKYLEAPVLGSSPEALQGRLLIMTAGQEDVYTQVDPLLQDLGSKIRYVGEVGKAASLKLALNQLLVAEVAAFSLSLAMVREAGVPVEAFMDIVSNSSIRSPQFEKKLPRMMERDFSDPHFPVSHMLKDVDLVLEEAGRYQLGTESLRGIRTIVARALEMGFVEEDYSALYNGVHPASGSDR